MVDAIVNVNLKILVILLINFIVSGCSNEYVLEIKDGKIKERNTIVFPLENLNENCNSNIRECGDSALPVENIFPLTNNTIEKYKEIQTEDENNMYVTRTYDFNYKNYKDSYVLNNCFENKDYKYNYGFLSIDITNFKCYQDSDINIKVVTNNIVYKHNADEKQGNTYIWYINKDNYDTKNISIKMNTYNITKIILSIILLIIFLLLIKYLYKKSQKVNEIN